jgi:NodT family efflux transporter outer membrane factor (OMF) lipoprotein
MRSALFLGLLALGCASSPGYRSSSIAVPPSFREVSDTARAVSYVAARPITTEATAAAEPAAPAISLDYWERLGDTTLSRLVREIQRANLDVQAARARVSAASSERTRAALDLTPSATVSGGYARQRLSSASFPGGFGTFPDQDVWTASVDPVWEFDLFGRLRHTVQARGALVDVAREDLRGVQVAFTAELARAYFVLRGAQEQLEVARRNAENQRHTYDVTRERLEAGRGSAFDTERAQAQLSSTLASIPAREAAVAEAQYRIGVLVGRSPTDLAQELAEPQNIPPLPDVTSIGDPAAVVRDRPDVASAERLAAAQRAFVGAAKANYLPRLTIGGSVGYAAPQFHSIGDQATFRYAVGPVITWPGLSLGRVKAEVDAARANETAARAQYNQAVLSALGEVETALTRYRSARLQVERLREASAASERAAELARLRFQEGVTDFLQVLDAERTQLDAQDRLAQGRVAAATAYAALYKAIGGR